MALVVLGLALAFGAGCATPDGASGAGTDGKTLRITEQTWATYQEYLQSMGGRKTGAFVVAMSGDVGVAGVYSYCPKPYDRCRWTSGAGPVNHAFQVCKEHDLDCVLFARGTEIVARYEVVQ
jgi:hypothetical protein